MTTDKFESKRQELLDKKLEIDNRLCAVKDAIQKAKREFWVTGKAADPVWLTKEETYARRLAISAQEIQRQLGQLRTEQKRFNAQNLGIEHFVHEVLLERMARESVAEIFSEAIRRKTIYDQDCAREEAALTEQENSKRKQTSRARAMFEEDFNRMKF